MLRTQISNFAVLWWCIACTLKDPKFFKIISYSDLFPVIILCAERHWCVWSVLIKHTHTHPPTHTPKHTPHARTHTHTHTHTHTRTVRCRNPYQETLNTEKREISLLPAGYEPVILVVNGSLTWIFWQLRLKGHLLHLRTQGIRSIRHPFTKPIR